MADSTNTLSGTQGLLAQWRHDYEAMKAQRDSLLAACKFALDEDSDWFHAAQALRAAIAKAEGQVNG